METLSEFLGGRSLHRTFRECNLAAGVAAASLGVAPFSPPYPRTRVRCEAKKKAAIAANEEAKYCESLFR